MRTIWVYKGTPNPPVKPSVFSTEASYLIFVAGWHPPSNRPSRSRANGYCLSPPPRPCGESIEAVGCSTDCDCRRIDCLRSTHLWDVEGRRPFRPDSSDGVDSRGDRPVRTEHQNHRRLVAVRMASRTHDGREWVGDRLRRMEGDERAGCRRLPGRILVLHGSGTHLGQEHPDESDTSEPKLS